MSQTGDGNTSNITQMKQRLRRRTVTQSGNDNLSDVYQNGSNFMTVTVLQTGDDNTSESHAVRATPRTADIFQEGNGVASTVNQNGGRSNSAFIDPADRFGWFQARSLPRAGLVPCTRNNTANVTQSAAANGSDVTQSASTIWPMSTRGRPGQ